MESAECLIFILNSLNWLALGQQVEVLRTCDTKCILNAGNALRGRHSSSGYDVAQVKDVSGESGGVGDVRNLLS